MYKNYSYNTNPYLDLNNKPNKLILSPIIYGSIIVKGFHIFMCKSDVIMATSQLCG